MYNREIMRFNYEVIKIWEVEANNIFDNHLYGLYSPGLAHKRC